MRFSHYYLKKKKGEPKRPLLFKTKQEQKHSVQTRFSKLREVRHDLVLTKHGSAPENIRHRPKRTSRSIGKLP